MTTTTHKPSPLCKANISLVRLLDEPNLYNISQVRQLDETNLSDNDDQYDYKVDFF